MERLSAVAFPETIAHAAKELGSSSVAFTYNRKEFFQHMDAANVDLKGFSEDFYRRICSAHLQPVLDTLSTRNGPCCHSLPTYAVPISS
jgi:pyruvate formate lyase activating enzyme